jgi:thiamine-phosphate pyrophosphorylase
LRVQATGAVDYCGYGPFAHTNTKPNNKPLLGFEGYRQLEKYAVDIPVIAVGGIQLGDVEPLMQTPIHGVAVSAAVNLAVDPAATLREFYKKVY